MKRIYSCVAVLLLLCICLTGCLEELPAGTAPTLSLPEATTTLLATELPEESTAEETSEPTIAPVTEAATEPATEETTEPATEAPTEPVHLHEFLAATCTAPKTCVSCGETTGSALGHSWKDATCSSPKVCTRCSTTTGSVGEHRYSGGVCKDCGSVSESVADGDPDNDDSSGGTVYRTPTGKRYHLDPDCGGKNSYPVSLSRAKSAGLTPCKKCAT